MIHGFAASGALFYRLLKPLREHFCLLLIDVIGMGASSRPNNFMKDDFDAQESINYFVNYIEKWRVKIGSITDFYLAGHSYGGYIAGHYALKYHQHIKKLLMISPLGVRVPPAGELW